MGILKKAPLNRGKFRGKSTRGFTLLEIMMVVAVIGIASAIALPRISVAIRKARSESEAKRFKSVLTHTRYLARSSLRCAMVQVKRNVAAEQKVGWEAKIWSYDSCGPPANSYPINGGHSPYPGEKLEKMITFNASLVDFPDSDPLAILDGKFDSGKDVILLFNPNGGLQPLAVDDLNLKTTTYRVRSIHEHYGRLYRFAIYPVTGSVRLCEPIDRDSICSPQ